MATCMGHHDFRGLYVLKLRRVLEKGLSTSIACFHILQVVGIEKKIIQRTHIKGPGTHSRPCSIIYSLGSCNADIDEIYILLGEQS